MLARASRLSAGARAALEIIAVIGPRAEMALVRDLAADPAGFEECVTSGMLRAEGQILTFRHELARQAVLDSLPAQRRAALHGAVLRALLARGEPDAA
ncbi:MAG TPA: helix-turn-helix transcriptional regulator, partial [bacterium]|nr:helix-turn-helix transcriptional regulator [bacterium]